MLNQYPLWKYLLVAFVLVVLAIYSAPNLYTPDPALQITGESSALQIGQPMLDKALAALGGGIAGTWQRVEPRFGAVAPDHAEQQLRAQSAGAPRAGRWLHRGAQPGAHHARLAQRSAARQ